MATDNARKTHVAPGIYQRLIEVKPDTTRSIGLTTLGLVGETIKGRAFEPTPISSWENYQDEFGGTDTELFKETKYPKYELPYIAKSYLSQSNQLVVTRVLGLSGYNAGPAWVIKAVGGGVGDGMIVAVIRSRGVYQKSSSISTPSNEEIPSGKILNNETYLVQGPGTITYGPNNIVYSNDDTFLGVEGYTTYVSSDSATTKVYFNCGTKYAYDTLIYDVDPDTEGSYLQILPAQSDLFNTYCGGGSYDSDDVPPQIPCSATDLGTFVLKGKTIYGEEFEFTVSLNNGTKNYIYDVIGNNINDNTTPIYIEELYDVALRQLVLKQGKSNDYIDGLFYEACKSFGPSEGEQPEPTATIGSFSPTDGIGVAAYVVYNGSLTPTDNDYVEYNLKKYYSNQIFVSTVDVIGNLITTFTPNGNVKVILKSTNIATNGLLLYSNKPNEPSFKPVEGLLNVPNQLLNKTYLGKRFLFSSQYCQDTDFFDIGKDRMVSTQDELPKNDGIILVVKKVVDASGKVSYRYEFDSVNTFGVDNEVGEYLKYNKPNSIVYVINQDVFFKQYADNQNTTETDVDRIIGDMNDYKESYKAAVTPWFVSEMKGNYNKNDVLKLFRFHTESDGNLANYLVKISIVNIKPDNLTFDVQVRSFNDSDANPIILESYSGLNMNPNSTRYIGAVIGTTDGGYLKRSKYVSVEMADNENIRYSVPCGFIGYPVRNISNGGSDVVKKPNLAYNITWDKTVKDRRQYFGFSDMVGIDTDILSYKGRCGYTDGVVTDCFHLDSRVTTKNTTVDGESIQFPDEDGNLVYLYTWQTVATNNVLDDNTTPPQITSIDDMTGSIYERLTLRKFTALTYGGFDGWDIYRQSRTTGDAFKYGNYKGFIDADTGSGAQFSYIKNLAELNLNEKGITSDYYAWLSGIRSFANTSEVDINIFATPGIDYVKDRLLVDEAIEMISTERMDSLYVITTPDKPIGSSDSKYDMYESFDAVGNLEISEIDTLYGCTYYPWIRFYDDDLKRYIFLPPTKDVVRNMALADNTSYAWFPPAGKQRGGVQCVNARKAVTLSDEDLLYAGRINPLKTFNQDGVYINGQKTLLSSTVDGQELPLTRIGVVRMMLKLQKQIAASCRSMIFQPNDAATRATFRNLVTPILDDTKSSRGISDYKIEVSDSIEDYQQRQLSARIWVKPIESLEYISIDFMVTPEGVEFR